MILGEVGLKENEPTNQAWLDVLDLLDKYQLSADDVIVLAETLFDMASKYLEEEYDAEEKTKKSSKLSSMYSASTIIRNPTLDRFPLSKSRWGLDPTLLTEEN